MTNDANHNTIYDNDKTLKIIKNRVEKIEKIMHDYNVDLITACKRANIKVTTYNRDKDLLKGSEQMLKAETLIQPKQQDHPHMVNDPVSASLKTHRVSLDLPDDVYEYIVAATLISPFKVKTIAEHVFTQHVREKIKKGERLI